MKAFQVADTRWPSDLFVVAHGATPGDLPAALPEELTAIHVGGSYSTVTEPTASSLRQLVAREKDRRLISYDPNIRASVDRPG